MKQIYSASIKKGKLVLQNPKKFTEDIRKFDGRSVLLTVEHRTRRTIQQNRYWWACITIIAKELGYTKDEMHEICKFKFLKEQKVDEKTGQILEYLGSTAQLEKEDFANLMDELIRWAAMEFNIVLPSPDEQLEFEMSKNNYI